MPARPTVSTLAREHALQLLKPGHGKKRPSRGAAPQEKEDLLEGKLSHGQSYRFAFARAGEGRVLREQDQIVALLLLLIFLLPFLFYCIRSRAYIVIASPSPHPSCYYLLSLAAEPNGTSSCRTCSSALKIAHAPPGFL